MSSGSRSLAETGSNTDSDPPPKTEPPFGTGPIEPFDFQPRTRVVFGPGTLAKLGTLTREYGGNRVFLVTDPGLAEAGHDVAARDHLRAVGIDPVIYAATRPNPTETEVAKATEVAKEHNIDFLIGLGGGSSMDCAKGVNFLLTNGGRMRDYRGVDRATEPMLPMIAVPTTAGTGSEAQSFALISEDDTHVKMACGDRKAACRVAILDPDLTASVPRSVAIATALDAVSHALETHVTRVRNPISRLFSRRAWGLLASGIGPVIGTDRTPDADARGRMLLGAHLAGTAIENSMLGAAHATANPLTARFDITHGLAVAVMLPHVIRYNAELVRDCYRELAVDIGLVSRDDPQPERALIEQLTGWLALAKIPARLADWGVSEADLPTLAQDASQQWTGTFNPRPVDADSLLEIYRWAY